MIPEHALLCQQGCVIFFSFLRHSHVILRYFPTTLLTSVQYVVALFSHILTRRVATLKRR